jgi:hypothetical protein
MSRRRKRKRGKEEDPSEKDLQRGFRTGGGGGG